MEITLPTDLPPKVHLYSGLDMFLSVHSVSVRYAINRLQYDNPGRGVEIVDPESLDRIAYIPARPDR